MGTIIFVRRVSRYIEGKLVREPESKKSRIQISERIFVRAKKGVWRQR